MSPHSSKAGRAAERRERNSHSQGSRHARPPPLLRSMTTRPRVMWHNHALSEVARHTPEKTGRPLHHPRRRSRTSNEDAATSWPLPSWPERTRRGGHIQSRRSASRRRTRCSPTWPTPAARVTREAERIGQGLPLSTTAATAGRLPPSCSTASATTARLTASLGIGRSREQALEAEPRLAAASVVRAAQHGGWRR